MENLAGPISGLLFLQGNHTVLDKRQGILKFPFISTQLKTASHRYANILEPILNPTEITIPPNDRVLIMTNSLLYPENAVVTGILTAIFKYQKNNFTDHPYKLKKGLHIAKFANFSVMGQFQSEQIKDVKPVDPVSTWHLLQNDREHAAHYVSSLIKTNKNPQNPANYWFLTAENPGNPLQDLETLDPTEDEESKAKFPRKLPLERFQSYA